MPICSPTAGLDREDEVVDLVCVLVADVIDRVPYIDSGLQRQELRLNPDRMGTPTEGGLIP